MTQIITTWITLFAVCCTSGLSYSATQNHTTQVQQTSIPNMKQEHKKSQTSQAIRKAIVTAAVCTACCVVTPTFLGSIHGFLSTHHNNFETSANIATNFYNMIMQMGLPEFFAYFYAKGLEFGASYYAVLLQVVFEVIQAQAANDTSPSHSNESSEPYTQPEHHAQPAQSFI